MRLLSVAVIIAGANHGPARLATHGADCESQENVGEGADYAGAGLAQVIRDTH